MERSSLIKGGLIALLVAVYVGGRVAQDRAANPPQPEETATPSTPESGAQKAGQPIVTGPVKELKKEDVRVGPGKEAKEGQRVLVNYRGMLTDGTVFDESYKRGQPFDFVLGEGSVIKGWDVGVAGMKEGGKRRLIIPSDMAYGPSGRPPTIPPNAPLVFDIELLKVG
ncbi:MAG TPA: FKBP-type peptidyl-prolyl cis-trans isomerase [Abditibacteriaceae bacterium]|jgi:FKBP-type peptidyl-prolyl cis-trans isomerase